MYFPVNKTYFSPNYYISKEQILTRQGLASKIKGEGGYTMVMARSTMYHHFKSTDFRACWSSYFPKTEKQILFHKTDQR